MNQKGPSLFLVISQLLLPLALVAVAFFEEDAARFWAFVLLAGFSLVIAFLRPLWGGMKGVWFSLSEARVSRRSQAELCRLALRFAELVGDRTDNLGYIVRDEALRKNIERLTRVSDMESGIFRPIAQSLHNRACASRGARSVVLATEELYSLMNLYFRHCMEPVFGESAGSASELRSGTISMLEDFRERFGKFRDELDSHGRHLTERVRAARLGFGPIPRPRPLIPPSAGDVDH